MTCDVDADTIKAISWAQESGGNKMTQKPRNYPPLTEKAVLEKAFYTVIIFIELILGNALTKFVLSNTMKEKSKTRYENHIP